MYCCICCDFSVVDYECSICIVEDIIVIVRYVGCCIIGDFGVDNGNIVFYISDIVVIFSCSGFICC